MFHIGGEGIFLGFRVGCLELSVEDLNSRVEGSGSGFSLSGFRV